VTDALVEVENLEKFFPVKLPALQRVLMREPPVVHAVDGVSFTLRPGEIFGLVGESGCGKTTVGRTVLRLLEPNGGTIRFEGQDITHAKERDLRAARQAMQIIFQDPHASLNPAMTIGQSIADPLLIHEMAKEPEAKAAALAIMTEVGLSPAEQLYAKYPSDLSGGQKQRAVIARAMILRPKFIVADEPVAMLDMSIRAKILDLILELKNKYGLTYLFITHDLATAKLICDRIAIMYLGRIVEVGDSKEIFREPRHPYTKALLGAVPIPDPDRRRFKTLPKGEVPDAIYPPLGCRFHPRCPVATNTCGWEPRDLLDLLDQRALDEATRVADEGHLVPRDRMHVDGGSLRLRVETGIPRKQIGWLVALVLLSAVVFLGLNLVVGFGMAAAGLLALLGLNVLAQREAAGSGWLNWETQRMHTHVEAILKSAPEPMRAAVRQVVARPGEVAVDFWPSADPGLRDVAGVSVRCVLY